MNKEYFMELVEELTPEMIESRYFRRVSELLGSDIAGKLILIYEEVYPGSKEDQRKITVPKMSTFTRSAHKARLETVSCETNQSH